jgi:hypothetical protein
MHELIFVQFLLAAAIENAEKAQATKRYHRREDLMVSSPVRAKFIGHKLPWSLTLMLQCVYGELLNGVSGDHFWPFPFLLKC